MHATLLKQSSAGFAGLRNSPAACMPCPPLRTFVVPASVSREHVIVGNARTGPGAGARSHSLPQGDPVTAAGVVCEEGAIRVRRFAGDDADFALMARWLNEPHVREWWDPDGPVATAETARRDYGPYTEPASPGSSCFIELEERPVGFIQLYPWSSETDYCSRVGITVEPDAWAFDVFIGEAAVVGTGVATRALDMVCRHLLDDMGATAVVIVTEVGNVRAHHVYEKLGFVKELDFLDTDTRGGERVRSYLMRRSARSGS